MRIALVEDAMLLRESLLTAFRRQGWQAAATGDGEEAWWLLRDGRFDCAILDIMLPGCTGLELLRRMREANDMTPVILLTARDAIEDRVDGLKRGADDYLIKPFAISELMARVEALTRRTHGRASELIVIGPLEIDPSAHRCLVDGIELQLPRRERQLLELLARHAGEYLAKTRIEEHLYDPAIELASNAVEAAVCQLRARLRDAGADGLLQTSRGVGYRLCVP